MGKRVGSFFLFLTLILTSALWGSEEAGKVISFQGKAQVFNPGANEWKELKVNQKIFPAEVLKTGKNSNLKILLKDNSTVILQSESKLTIKRVSILLDKAYRDVLLNLEKGMARFKISRGYAKNSRFEVVTPLTQIRVEKTDFTVRVISESQTRVGVREGSLNLRLKNFDLTLNTGDALILKEEMGKIILDVLGGDVEVGLKGVVIRVGEGESISIDSTGRVEVIRGEIDVYFAGKHYTFGEGESFYPEELYLGVRVPTGEGAASPATP